LAAIAIPTELRGDGPMNVSVHAAQSLALGVDA
jgi:hypothetical protein